MGANSTKQLVTVDGKTYKKKRVLGEGRFGFVFLVKDKQTKIRYAVKQIYTQDKEHLALANQEAEMLKKLSPHPNIVRHIAHTTVPDARGGKTLYILTEYCSGGQLSDIIAAREGTKFPEKQVLSIFSQICRGVQQLHSARPHPIAHRDLKVENVIMHEDGTYKLCDLGSATLCGNRTFETAQERALLAEELQKFTTVQYRAPEMVDPWSGKGVSERADLWALGCILFLLAFLHLPFPAGGCNGGCVGGGDVCGGREGSGRFEFPSDSTYSARLHDLVSALLRVDPDDRPSIDTVVEILGSKSLAIPAAHTPDKAAGPAGAGSTPAQRQAEPADRRHEQHTAPASSSGNPRQQAAQSRPSGPSHPRCPSVLCVVLGCPQTLTDCRLVATSTSTPPKQRAPDQAQAGVAADEGPGWVAFGDAEKPSSSSNPAPAGMRGVCVVCKDPVLAEQERTKGKSGQYCHQGCFRGMALADQRIFALGQAS